MDKNKSFDVFLSYNRKDKDTVAFLAQRLRQEADLNPWLDEWNLVPGEPWQEALEEALDNSRTCAVFIGPSGLGPWQNEEMRAALDGKVKHSILRVIPILLPGATLPERSELPPFLSRLTWVDFRSPEGLSDIQAFERLVTGITGSTGSNFRPKVPDLTSEPYRGLEAFGEEHARFFFGREALTQHLLEDLRNSRFLAIVGPSGSGKSSLARAGLICQLKQGTLPQSDMWTYIVLKPGANPVEELALNLLNLTNQKDLSQVQKLITYIEKDERSLHQFVRLSLFPADVANRLFILVDQFEEVFTVCKSPEERDQFINCLRYAATITTGQTIFALTMRADFLTIAAENISFAELVSKNQCIVGPMDNTDLRRAIEEPAKSVGLEFENGLVDTIVRDGGYEPGTLPLLEHTMLQLCEHRDGDERITFRKYHNIGGVRGALAKKAEDIWHALELQDQKLMRRILLRLTEPGQETGDTRRRTKLRDLWVNNIDEITIRFVVDRLATARLLTLSTDSGGETQVDIAHEALIRGWPRLQAWLDESRGTIVLQRRVSAAAEEWNAHNKDASFLFRGKRLAEIEELKENLEPDLNKMERDFLAASVLFNKKERQGVKRRLGIFILAASLICISLSFAYYLSVKRFEAQQTAEREALVAEGFRIGFMTIPLRDTRVVDITSQINLNSKIKEIMIVDNHGRITDAINPDFWPSYLTDDPNESEIKYKTLQEVIKLIPPIINLTGMQISDLKIPADSVPTPEGLHSESPRSVITSLETEQGTWYVIVVVD